MPALTILLLGCGQEDDTRKGASDTVVVGEVCHDGLLPVAFLEEGELGAARWDLAADFTLPTLAGEFAFSSEFTGCDTYVFATDALTVSPQDGSPLVHQEDDYVELMEKSPPNAHYFFVSTARSEDAVQASIDAMAAAIDAALGSVDPDTAAHFSERLHVVSEPHDALEAWVSEALTSPDPGFAIDRSQRIRELGSLADVNRFDRGLNNAGYWPWEDNLAYIAHMPQYFNFEAAQDAALSEQAWTSLYLFYNEDLATTGRQLFDVTFPDAETMQGFDTMLVDLRHTCDTSQREYGNCDAWDALQYLYLCEPDEDTAGDCHDIEIARYITTYHREGRWVADASQLLPYVRAGGTMRLRFQGARGGHFNTLRILLGAQDKGIAPLGAEALWEGGSFNEDYDDNHKPITVDVPAEAERVYLQAIISGHGFGNEHNCAEFCDHQHHFTINGETFTAEHPEIGDDEDCLKKIPEGTVPNQYGTWWYARSSWCPGKEVDPWVWDVTDVVTPGEPVTISYRTNHGDPVTGGSVILTSNLVFWQER